MSDYLDSFTPAPTDPLRCHTTQFVTAATDTLTELERIGTYQGCQRPTWSWNSDFDYRHLTPRTPILSGQVSNRRPAAARQAALQWANALGLTPSPKAQPGTVTYTGEIDGLKVEIWAVVDSAAFGGKRAMLKLYAPDFILSALFITTATAAGILLSRYKKLAKLAKPLTE